MTIRYAHGNRQFYNLYHVILDVHVEGEALCGFNLADLPLLPSEPIGMSLCSFCGSKAIYQEQSRDQLLWEEQSRDLWERSGLRGLVRR